MSKAGHWPNGGPAAGGPAGAELAAILLETGPQGRLEDARAGGGAAPAAPAEELGLTYQEYTAIILDRGVFL